MHSSSLSACKGQGSHGAGTPQQEAAVPRSRLQDVCSVLSLLQCSRIPDQMGTLGNRPPAGKGFQFVVSLQCGFHATSQQQIASFFLWRTEREVSSSKTGGEGRPAREVTVGNALTQVLPEPGRFHRQQDSGQGSFLALVLTTVLRSHLPSTSSIHHRQF